MKIGRWEFDTRNEVYMMGILNVTPDSFSDGGRFLDRDAAMLQVERMIAEGADVIDVGGESTRPGFSAVSEEEEKERVLPIIEAIAAEFDIPISLDTYKAGVAGEGLKAGAVMINDIWGLKQDPQMAAVIAGAGASCVLMHNRRESSYENLMEDILSDLRASLQLAKDAGIDKDRILIDPGIGFAKDTEQNLQVLGDLQRLLTLDYPLLLAASRKSVIGNTLHLPTDRRLEGTLALTTAGVLAGASFFRVHDVAQNKLAAQMALALRKAKNR